MEMFHEAEIDPAPLTGKRVAIIGFGNQGRAQALNLKDSGIDVVIGLRDGSPRRGAAVAAGLNVETVAQATAGADMIMLLAPDEVLSDIYRGIEPDVREGATLGFSHGLAIHFGLIVPRPDLDVIMVAPKGPGHTVRSEYSRWSSTQ